MTRRKGVELEAGKRYSVEAKLESGGTWSFGAYFQGVKIAPPPRIGPNHPAAQGPEVKLTFDNGVEIDASAVAGWKVREIEAS